MIYECLDKSYIKLENENKEIYYYNNKYSITYDDWA